MSKVISELEKKLKGAKGTEKIDLLNLIAEKYVRIDENKFLLYAKEACEFSKEKNYQRGLVKCHENMAFFYILKGDIKRAEQFLKDAIAYAKKNTRLLYEIDILFTNFYRIQGKYLKAYNKVINALDYFAKINDIYHLVEAYNSLGILYFEQKKIAEAKESYLKGIELAQKYNESELELKLKVNLAILYQIQNDTKKALSIFLEVYNQSKEKMCSSFVANILNNIANIYILKNELQEAKKYLYETINLSKKSGNQWLKAIAYSNLSMLLKDEEKFEEAEKYAKEANEIFKKVGQSIKLESSIFALYELYEKWGKYKLALDYLKQYHEIHLKRNEEEHNRKLLEFETKYKVKQKEKLIKKIGKEKRTLSQKLQKNIQQLKEFQMNNDFYNLILDNTFSTILIINENLDIVYANNKFYKIFELDKNSIKNLAEAFDNAELESLKEQIFSQQNEAMGYSSTIKTRKGNKKYIQYKKTEFQDKDGNLYYFISIKDITFLAENEDKLRLLVRAFEQSPTIIAITDIQGNILYVNPKFTKVTQYTMEEVFNKHSRILKSDQSNIDYKELWETILSGKEWRGRFLNKKKDGTTYWESASISPVWDDFGEITHFIKISEDITKMIKLEQERDRLIKQLKSTNAAKDKMFSIIAHDLKSPFSTIFAFVNLMKKNYDKYDKKHLFKLINELEKSTSSGYTLLENLLTWSRMESGRMKYNPQKLNLSEIISRVYDLYTIKAAQKGIELIANIQPEIYVFADNFMIETVLRNLVNNAIKFTLPNGTITISVNEKSDEYIVSVSDTGIGIPKENLKKLFKIETAYSTFGTAYEKGTGLGLILCKEFVEKNNGKIWVESEENKGTTFYFTLKKADLKNR